MPTTTSGMKHWPGPISRSRLKRLSRIFRLRRATFMLPVGKTKPTLLRIRPLPKAKQTRSIPLVSKNALLVGRPQRCSWERGHLARKRAVGAESWNAEGVKNLFALAPHASESSTPTDKTTSVGDPARPRSQYAFPNSSRNVIVSPHPRLVLGPTNMHAQR